MSRHNLLALDISFNLSPFFTLTRVFYFDLLRLPLQFNFENVCECELPGFINYFFSLFKSTESGHIQLCSVYLHTYSHDSIRFSFSLFAIQLMFFSFSVSVAQLCGFLFSFFFFFFFIIPYGCSVHKVHNRKTVEKNEC